MMLHNKESVADRDALFFHVGMTSRKRGANGKPVLDYPFIGVVDVTQCEENINEGQRVMWMHFLSLVAIHCVTSQFCTCALYSTLNI